MQYIDLFQNRIVLWHNIDVYICLMKHTVPANAIEYTWNIHIRYKPLPPTGSVGDSLPTTLQWMWIRPVSSTTLLNFSNFDKEFYTVYPIHYWRTPIIKLAQVHTFLATDLQSLCFLTLFATIKSSWNECGSLSCKTDDFFDTAPEPEHSLTMENILLYFWTIFKNPHILQCSEWNMMFLPGPNAGTYCQNEPFHTILEQNVGLFVSSYDLKEIRCFFAQALFLFKNITRNKGRVHLEPQIRGNTQGVIQRMKQKMTFLWGLQVARSIALCSPVNLRQTTWV